jgi:hypothetical protein
VIVSGGIVLSGVCRTLASIPFGKKIVIYDIGAGQISEAYPETLRARGVSRERVERLIGLAPLDVDKYCRRRI